MQNELKQIANMALFAKIVQIGGISRCAFELGMERTTISRRLADLEKGLGVQLLVRSPTEISLTDAGSACFESCQKLLEESVTARTVATKGKIVFTETTVTVGAPPDIVDNHLNGMLAAFESENPNLRTSCYPISDWSDESFSLVDMLVTWNPGRSSSIYRTQLKQVAFSIYATPQFVEKKIQIATPFDLQHLPIIEYDNLPGNQQWQFGHQGEQLDVRVTPQYQVSGMLDAQASVLASIGACRLPDYFCKQHVKKGRLVRLLPTYQLNDKTLYLVSPRNGGQKPREIGLRSFLESQFGKLKI